MAGRGSVKEWKRGEEEGLCSLERIARNWSFLETMRNQNAMVREENGAAGTRRKDWGDLKVSRRCAPKENPSQP